MASLPGAGIFSAYSDDLCLQALDLFPGEQRRPAWEMLESSVQNFALTALAQQCMLLICWGISYVFAGMRTAAHFKAQ